MSPSSTSPHTTQAGVSAVWSAVLRPCCASPSVFLAKPGRWRVLVAGVRGCPPAGGTVVYVCASFFGGHGVFPWPVSLGGRHGVPAVRGVIAFPRAWLARALTRVVLAPRVRGDVAAVSPLRGRLLFAWVLVSEEQAPRAERNRVFRPPPKG